WILIMFILLFLLLEGRMLTRRAVQVVGPSREVQGRAGVILSDMARQVRTYLVWRTIINFGLAIVVGLVYHVAGLRQAWTLAMRLVAAIKAICYHVPGWRPWANLMGTTEEDIVAPVPLELAAAGLAAGDEGPREPSPHDTVIHLERVKKGV